MKEKLMSSYRKLQIFLKEKDFKTKILESETTYEYKNGKGEIVDFVLPKGTYVLDCDNETFAKVCDMNAKVNTAWIKGVITLEEIEKICVEVWE